MSDTLVLLHGFAGTRRGWDLVVAHLPPERYRALALDLPGHGELHAERPIDFDSCVQSVLRRSPERFALCGYSMGGRIALHVALHAPERVSRLVLVSATAGIEDSRERAERRAADELLAEQIERGTIEQFSESWRAQSMFAKDPLEVDRLARADQARNQPVDLAASLRGIGTGQMEPLWEQLHRLSMPVAIVVGSRDHKFTALGRRMLGEFPDAILKIVPGGHSLALESPAAVAEAFAGPTDPRPSRTRTAR